MTCCSLRCRDSIYVYETTQKKDVWLLQTRKANPIASFESATLGRFVSVCQVIGCCVPPLAVCIVFCLACSPRLCSCCVLSAFLAPLAARRTTSHHSHGTLQQVSRFSQHRRSTSPGHGLAGAKAHANQRTFRWHASQRSARAQAQSKPTAESETPPPLLAGSSRCGWRASPAVARRPCLPTRMCQNRRTKPRCLLATLATLALTLALAYIRPSLGARSLGLGSGLWTLGLSGTEPKFHRGRRPEARPHAPRARPQSHRATLTPNPRTPSPISPSPRSLARARAHRMSRTLKQPHPQS